MAAQRILLMGGDTAQQRALRAVLEFMEHSVAVVNEPAVLAQTCSDEPPTVAFLTHDSALEPLMDAYRQMGLKAPVVMVKDKGTATAMPEGFAVASFLDWPSTHSILADLLQRLLKSSGERTVKPLPELGRWLVGETPAICTIRKLVGQVAGAEATVLILGDSGTGKEVIARGLHYCSPRREKPFVPVNCGAIPGELLESELFGHEKGAFTGALTSRQGRFELAEGGTLFLDEIGDMPLSMQVKLLRVLQERTFERVGSNKTIQCDVRIVAATHRNLEEEIRNNRFREDLFYRLNVFPIEVPPLRERVEDIPLLVEEMVRRIENEKRGSVCLTSAALAALQQHHWPGNVRELANLIERLAILYPESTVDVGELPEKFQQYTGLPRRDQVDFFPAAEMDTLDLPALGPGMDKLPEDGLDLKEHLSNLECHLIQQALEECNGVVAHAANLLRMRRTTLVEKLRKYGLRGDGDEV